MPMRQKKYFNKDLVTMLLVSIQNAIDCTNEALADYPTKNSRSNLFWDETNKKIMDNMQAESGVVSCKPFITNRGCWKFALLYSNGIIFSIMREQRFQELKKELAKNSKLPHYAVSMARVLNVDVKDMQGCLFHSVDAEVYRRAVEITEKLLAERYFENDVIDGYLMILFDADNTQLYSARMVLVNGALEVCDEYDLKDYIKIKELVIVESAKDYPNGKPEDPTRGLKLTGKAEVRKLKKQKTTKQIIASEVNENIK